MYMYCNGKPIKVYSLVAVYIIILLKGPRRDSSGRYCRDICGLYDYVKEEIASNPLLPPAFKLSFTLLILLIQIIDTF